MKELSLSRVALLVIVIACCVASADPRAAQAPISPAAPTQTQAPPASAPTPVPVAPGGQGPTAAVIPQDAILSEARQSYDSTNYERARDLLDSVIAALGGTASRPENRPTVVAAYELRARTRVNLKDLDGARTDFRAMLLLDPAYLLSTQVGPRVLSLFEEVKKTTVGTVAVVVTPEDAIVTLDDARLPADASALSLVGGTHTIAASRTGYAASTQSFTVIPGTAPLTVTVALERISSSLALATSPGGIEVIIDGVSRGVTEQDAEAKTPEGGLMSKRFVVNDLGNGRHRIEFRRECFLPAEQQIDVPRASDYKLDLVKMTPAVATVTVESNAPGSTVFVDDAPRGAAPMVMTDICRGPHTLEVRSRFGRHLKRIDVKPGESEAFQARIRPAFAILSDSGAAGAVRGGPDLRLAAEAAFQDSNTVTFIAPPEKRVAELFAADKLPIDWLAYDILRRPIGGAATIGEPARRDFGAKLARAFDAQGVAAIARDPAGDQNDMLLILLAPGSAEPDVLRWRLDNLQSIREAVRRLDQAPPLFRSSIGLVPIDVVDVDGAVVAAVESGGGADGAGIKPGEIIATANGKPVTGASQFLSDVSAHQAGQPLSLEVRDRAGMVRKVDVRVQAVPNVISFADQALPANKLALEYTYRAGTLANALEETSVRLNIAAVSMRLRKFNDAKGELERVVKVVGDGAVPGPLGDAIAGTANYLLGLSNEGIGDTASAERAWRLAQQSRGNLLTENGEALKDLSEQRLNQQRTSR